MPAAADASYWVEVEDTGALEEKLCEKGIKGKGTQPKSQLE